MQELKAPLPSSPPAEHTQAQVRVSRLPPVLGLSVRLCAVSAGDRNPAEAALPVGGGNTSPAIPGVMGSFEIGY